MVTTAQIAANRANSQLSTGPKTDAGKAVVAQNSLRHGLSSRSFTLLPNESREDYEALLSALEHEHSPETPTEKFLVAEMAQAQWKLLRVQAIEAELLTPADTGWSAVTARFRSDCGAENALLKLNRYEASARRAWHKALEQLLKLRDAAERSAARESRRHASEMEALVHEMMAAPVPPAHTPAELPATMPAHLQRELDEHLRRDPLFDPELDRTQMSKGLQKWLRKQAA